MPAVLLTGSRAPATLDLARRFAEEGAFVVVADSQSAVTSASRSVGAAYRVPSARFRPREFAAAVAGIARRHAVELVVPTCEETFWLAAAAEERFPALRSRLFSPSIGTLRLLHDKAAFLDVLDGIGVAHPATEVIGSHIAWRRRVARRATQPRGALVVKPAFSRFGTHTLFVATGERMPGVGRITRDERWLVQERVEGSEFCCYAIAVAGKVTAFVAYRPVWRAGVGAGVAFERLDPSSDPGAEARRVAERLAEELSLTGQFGLDLMATAAGVIALECNPRATSGVHLFGPGDGLAGAFSGEPARAPSRASARLGIPHAMYAVTGIRGPKDAARWLAQLRAPDVLRPPGDRLPIPALVRSVGVQLLTAARARISLTAAATYDLEWNGQPLPPASCRAPSPTDPEHAADIAAGVGSIADLAAFVDGVRAAGGTRPLVANVDVAMAVIDAGGEVLPVTSPLPATAGVLRAVSPPPPSYVVSPFTHYVRYAREELGELPSRTMRQAAGVLLTALGGVLRAGRIDDVVMVGNALLSTNLLPDLDETSIARVTDRLVAAHPGSAIAWRSVHGHGSSLPETLRRAGYRLIPSRSILFTATRDTEWQTLRDVKRDRALLEASAYRVRRLTELASAPEATGPHDPAAPPEPHPLTTSAHARIADLYQQLYVAKYSRFNPQYTAEFVALAEHTGLLEFTVLERDGRIDGVFGARLAHGLLAAPLVGYDTTLPQDIGLYRMLSYVIADTAHRRGADLHNSSGVADFKRNRGGETEIEYTAVLTRHLPLPRRLAWAVLGAVVTRIAVPMVQRSGL